MSGMTACGPHRSSFSRPIRQATARKSSTGKIYSTANDSPSVASDGIVTTKSAGLWGLEERHASRERGRRVGPGIFTRLEITGRRGRMIVGRLWSVPPPGSEHSRQAVDRPNSSLQWPRAPDQVTVKS